MHSSPFGTLPTGDPVEIHTLENTSGLQLKVIPYGASIVSLSVPDRDGRQADVVLGFSNLAGYAAPHPYIGAVAGRVAGRISGARFTLDGITHNLAVNDPPNHLHGGTTGFDRRLWSAQPVSRSDGADSLRLAYRSPDGEEGYPGTVDVAVTYTVAKDNALVIETEAVTDKATPFSPTQHAYFNLAGEGAGTIKDHQLRIFSDTVVPTDEHFGLLDRLEPVREANDFTRSRSIGEALPGLHREHGDAYRLPRSTPGECRVAARVSEPQTGRVLTVSTTEDYVQFYTARFLDGSLTGKSGRPYGPFSGFCLECEGYANGANHPELGDIILRPGQTFRQRTIFAFSVQ